MENLRIGQSSGRGVLEHIFSLPLILSLIPLIILAGYFVFGEGG